MVRPRTVRATRARYNEERRTTRTGSCRTEAPVPCVAQKNQTRALLQSCRLYRDAMRWISSTLPLDARVRRFYERIEFPLMGGSKTGWALGSASASTRAPSHTRSSFGCRQGQLLATHVQSPVFPWIILVMSESQPVDAVLGGQEETVFPAQSSVLDESALLEHVVREYQIGAAKSCRFLERGDADIYRVKTRGADYYLKVFRPPRSEVHAESEARFVARLAEVGVPVVCAVRRSDGAYASEVFASEGTRPILLFEEAPPPLPKELPVESMAGLGATIARVHEVADTDDSTYEIPARDLKTIEVERALHIREFASEEDSTFMAEVIEWIRPQLAAIPRETPEWGICHADLVMSNVRMGTDGLVLFDFGSIARTYRGFDLSVVYWSLGHRYLDQREELWEAFLKGYESVRSLPDRLAERLPALHALRELAFLGGNAATLPLRLGTEPFESDFMSDGFDRMRSILRQAGAWEIG